MISPSAEPLLTVCHCADLACILQDPPRQCAPHHWFAMTRVKHDPLSPTCGCRCAWCGTYGMLAVQQLRRLS